MARKVIKGEDTLDLLIPSYAEHKEQFDVIDGICKNENKQIKRLLEIGKKNTYEAGGYKVTRSVQNRDTMDEEALCIRLADFPLAYELGIIKVKEYVDMSMLEDAMYKKQLTPEMIQAIEKCREHKEIVTLRLSKVKKEDEE